MTHYSEIKNELREIGKLLAEFPEPVQPKVFDMLVDALIGKGATASAVSASTPPQVKSKPPKKKRAPGRKSFSVLKGLRLSGGNGKPSFVDFCREKNPTSNVEFNTVAIYYLQEVLCIDQITPNHVYTCYQKAGRKLPNNFRQSLWDTSGRRYAYIDAGDKDNLKIPHLGIALVEHELPKPQKKSKK